jgi:hypothetical protein
MNKKESKKPRQIPATKKKQNAEPALSEALFFLFFDFSLRIDFSNETLMCLFSPVHPRGYVRQQQKNKAVW